MLQWECVIEDHLWFKISLNHETIPIECSTFLRSTRISEREERLSREHSVLEKGRWILRGHTHRELPQDTSRKGNAGGIELFPWEVAVQIGYVEQFWSHWKCPLGKSNLCSFLIRLTLLTSQWELNKASIADEVQLAMGIHFHICLQIYVQLAILFNEVIFLWTLLLNYPLSKHEKQMHEINECVWLRTIIRRLEWPLWSALYRSKQRKQSFPQLLIRKCNFHFTLTRERGMCDYINSHSHNIWKTSIKWIPTALKLMSNEG